MTEDIGTRRTHDRRSSTSAGDAHDTGDTVASPEADRPILARLSDVLVLDGPTTDTVLYIGWTSDGRPVAVQNDDQLVPAVADAINRFGQSIREEPHRRTSYRSVTPSNFTMVGSAVDFANDSLTGGQAQDMVNIRMSDGPVVIGHTGVPEGRSLLIPESTLLHAILDADNPFQDTGIARLGDVAQEALRMYTLLLPSDLRTLDAGYGSDSTDALAILFPTLPNASNEVYFLHFVQQVVGRLLILDETARQNGHPTKGYIEVAARHAGVGNNASGIARLMETMKGMGLVDYSPRWLDGLEASKRRFGVGMIRAAAALGFVDIQDERVLDAYANPIPNYDLQNIDKATLMSLVDDMRRALRAATR